MIIRTKWGKMDIDPSKIHEVNIQFNPWDNIYKFEFVIEGSFNRLYAEMSTPEELTRLVSKLSRELSFVKQYKYRDTNTGQMQINEPRRLSAINERKRNTNGDI